VESNSNDLQPWAKEKDMRTSIARCLIAVAFVILVCPSPARADFVYDVGADWSDTTNPSGPWTYADGLGPITTHQSNWTGNSPGFPTPQPAWAVAPSGAGHIPVWFRSVNTAFDFLPGDVITHTWDGFSGLPGHAPSLLIWTSPFDATLDIVGTVWLARHIGRDVSFSLLIDGVATGIGDSSLADTARSTPDTFALNNVLVHAGGTVSLRFDTVSAAGDFVGVGLTIDATPTVAPVPEANTFLFVVSAVLIVLFCGTRHPISTRGGAGIRT